MNVEAGRGSLPTAPPTTPHTVALRPTAAGRIEVSPLLGVLAAHAIPGCETTDIAAGTHTRLLTAPDGPHAATIAVHPDRVDLTVPDATPATLSVLAMATRAWLDLDTDTAPIADALGTDPVLGPLVRARPALRVPQYPSGFEAALTTVLGQQVSISAMRTFSGRLASAYGTPGPAGLTLFPTPERIAAAHVNELRAAVGVTTARAAALHAVARAFAEGLRLDPAAPRADTRAALLALPGIGPWTADYLAVRTLADPDAFAPGDLVLRRALGGCTPREAAALAEAWRPWRAYALFHLWTGETYTER